MVVCTAVVGRVAVVVSWTVVVVAEAGSRTTVVQEVKAPITAAETIRYGFIGNRFD